MALIESENFCKYCFDVFQSPVLLQCGHSMCFPCARNAFDYEVLRELRKPSQLDAGHAGHAGHGDKEELDQENIVIKCPSCCEATVIPKDKGASVLPVNEPLQDAIACYLKNKAIVPKCGNDCGQDSTLECLRCQAPFCQTCFATLHSKTAFQSHEPLNLGELEVRKPLPCPLHAGKDLELFCETCQDIVCLMCYSFGDHKSHSCVFLKDHSDFCKRRIQRASTTIESLKTLSETAHKRALDMITDVSKVHDELDLRIDAVCTQLMEVIVQRKQALLRKSQRIRNIKIARLNEQVSSLVGHPSLLSKIARTFALMAESKNAVNVVAAVSNADSVLRLVDQSSLRMEPCDDALLFERLDGTSLSRALSTFGIVGTPAEVRNATQVASSPSPASVDISVPANKPRVVAAAAAAGSTLNHSSMSGERGGHASTPSGLAAVSIQRLSSLPRSPAVPLSHPVSAQGPSHGIEHMPAASVGPVLQLLSEFGGFEGEALRARYKKMLSEPLLFADFTEASQISAAAARFDNALALQLVDKTPLVKVLHFDNTPSGWISFDARRPIYMVKTRVFNGRDTEWEVQYSDNNIDWKSCGARLELNTSEWNGVSWRPAGGHRYWRLSCVSNRGQSWFEKFEWYYVPTDLMADMKKLMDAQAQAQAQQAQVKSPASAASRGGQSALSPAKVTPSPIVGKSPGVVRRADD